MVMNFSEISEKSESLGKEYDEEKEKLKNEPACKTLIISFGRAVCTWQGGSFSVHLKEDGLALLLLLHSVDADVVKQTGLQVSQADGGLGLGQNQLSAAAFQRRCVNHTVAWRTRT